MGCRAQTSPLPCRLGDSVIRAGDTVDFDWEAISAPWNNCAQELEASLAGDHLAQPIVHWLLVTDSSQLKAWAESKYPGKVLSGSNERIAHYTEHALQSAAVDNWLLGLTDYKVISDLSHFGRSAALRVHGNSSIYSVRQVWDDLLSVSEGKLVPIAGYQRRCDVKEPDKPSDVLRAWYEV